MKVDTHIHLAAAMTAKHLLSFMKKKISECPHDVVSKTRDGKQVTLIQTINNLGLHIDDFTINAIDVKVQRRRPCLPSTLATHNNLFV